MGGDRLPNGYVERCSLDALESLVLSRMNRAANLHAQAKQAVLLWVEAEAEVKVVQWMLEKRRSQGLRVGDARQSCRLLTSMQPRQSELLASGAFGATTTTTIPAQHLPARRDDSKLTAVRGHQVLVLAKDRRSPRSRLQSAALPVRMVARSSAV